MANVLQKAIELLTGSEPSFKAPKFASLKLTRKYRPFKQLSERQLIQLESEIGKELFGPIPSGHARKFFNLDPTTWIWYEEYQDDQKRPRSITTKYEIHETGVLKVQDGARYVYLEGDELRNFGVAVQMYYERVMRDIYQRDPATGQKML